MLRYAYATLLFTATYILYQAVTLIDSSHSPGSALAGQAEGPDTGPALPVSSVANIPAMCAWRLACSCDSYPGSCAGAQGTCTLAAPFAADHGIQHALAICVSMLVFCSLVP